MTDERNETVTGERGVFTCRDLVQLVTGYLDNALPAETRHQFEEHLAACEGCQHHLEQIRITVASVRALHEQDLPVETRDRLLSAFRSWKTTP